MLFLKRKKSGAGQDSSDTAESGVDAGIGEIKNSMTDSPVTGYDDMAGLYGLSYVYVSSCFISSIKEKCRGIMKLGGFKRFLKYLID